MLDRPQTQVDGLQRRDSAVPKTNCARDGRRWVGGGWKKGCKEGRERTTPWCVVSLPWLEEANLVCSSFVTETGVHF